MIMAKKEDGTYKQVGFIYRNSNISLSHPMTEIKKILNKEGKILFEKGFTREVESILPLTLNGINKPLKNYTIYGNTLQNGTPTPENPVEVRAVGERTRNLFDKNDCTVAGYIKNDGTISITADTWFTTANYIKCSGTITITALNGLDRVAHIACYDEQKNYLGVCLINASNENQSTINLINGTKYIKACSRNNNLDSLMLNEGSTALPYEPYGYKIPVVTRGKNLLVPIGFSANAITNINNNRGKTNSYGTSLSTVYGGSVLVTQAKQIDTTVSYMNGFFYIVVDFSKFTIGKKHILSFDYEIKEKHSATSTSIAYIGDSASSVNISGDWGKNGRKSVNFTVKEGLKPYTEIRLCGNSIFVSNIQIEKDSTATPYEPYHEPITTAIYIDKPLYKIGNYADSINYAEQKVERKIGIVDLGTMTYTKDVTSGAFKSVETLPNGRKLSDMESGNAICSAFKEVTANQVNTIPYSFSSVLNNSPRMVINGTGFEEMTVEDFKTAMNGVYVYYILETPEIKTVEPVEIPTINGTTVIDVDTAVKPTKMYTKYKSSK